MALGCIGEVFASAPGLIPTYFNDYLTILQAASNLKDPKVYRNISYGLGVLAQHAQILFQAHVNSSLELLNKIYEQSSSHVDHYPEARDNIIAAFARIVEF